MNFIFRKIKNLKNHEFNFFQGQKGSKNMDSIFYINLKEPEVRSGRVKMSGESGRDEIFQPELFESSENMKQTRLDIRVTRPTLPDSANPGF